MRPLEDADVPELTRIIETPEVARSWDAGAPWGEPDAATTMLTIVVGGLVAGLIQYSEQSDAVCIDLFLDPAMHGRGLGRKAIGLVARHLIDDRGHRRIAIDRAVC